MEKEMNSAEKKILDAAVVLFSQKGYRETNTREIVKLAGSSLSALHNYFGSKENLYYSVIERTVNSLYPLARIVHEMDLLHSDGSVSPEEAEMLLDAITDNLLKWIWNEENRAPAMIIHRQMLCPDDVFSRMWEMTMPLLDYISLLFRYMYPEMDTGLSDYLSFSYITQMFDMHNYPRALEETLRRKPSDEEVIQVSKQILLAFRPKK